MKLQYFLHRILPLSLLVLACSLTAAAYSFKVDGIYYTIYSSSSTPPTVSVTYGSHNYWPGDYRDTIVVPETVTYEDVTYTVTRVAWGAFMDCAYLKAVQLPNTITHIADYGFEGNSSLTSVNIPEGVVEIGGNSFSGNPKLEGMDLPSTLKTIGLCAFRGCKSITHINIPASVTSIGKSAFSYCSSLTSMSVESGNTVYDSRNNCNAIIETATNTLVSGCENTIIPNTVTTIGNGAFSGRTGITNINITNGVKTIREEAFESCSSLQSIHIPASVDTIAQGAFGYCPELLSITVASNNNRYDSRDNCNAIIEKETRTLIIGCRNTIIPNTVRKIGNSAFSKCTALTSIVIPNSVIYIGEYAFSGSTGLTEMQTSNAVRRIDFEALYGCTALKSITLPTTLTSLGNYAFQSCESLTTITIPNSIEELPQGLFTGCKGLVTINLPNTLKTIGSYAFYECEGLETLRIPESVTILDDWAFGHCHHLKYMTIPDLVSEYDDVFMGCYELEKITFGRGMKTITGDFWGCDMLNEIICLGTVPPVMLKNINSKVYNNAVLKVPNESIQAYMSTNYWYKFKHVQGLNEIANGDANCDGIINIADISHIIDLLLDPNSSVLPIEYGDMNKNGEIDIADVTLLIDLILGL